MPNPRNARYRNFSGTIEEEVAQFFTVEDGGQDPSTRLREHAASLRSFLQACFDATAPARPLGAGLSFSDVLRPQGAAIDTPNMNVLLPVWDAELDPAYRAQAPRRSPMYVEGGTVVNRINARLGDLGLALQTSGAGDAHRIAGCVATGTHGSALRVGAVHDTLMGVYLLVAPHEAVFALPAGSPIHDDLPRRLENLYGVPTTIRRDDEVFAAAQVSLGSLGVVLGVVIETVPIYRLARRVTPIFARDAGFWDAVRRTDPAGFLEAPAGELHHFEVIFHPYRARKSDDPGAYLIAMWKQDAGAVHPGPVPPNAPKASSAALHVASVLVGLGPVAKPFIRKRIDTELAAQFADADAVDFPGAFFGPTDLPRGYGASIELVVAQHDAVEALQSVQRTIADSGTNFAGVFSCRHVPRTNALLGMNQRDMNCFIELPGGASGGIEGLHTAIGQALTDAKIPWAFHWGQQTMKADLDDWYTQDNRERWRQVRRDLLSSRARVVFAAPLLHAVGLD